MVETPEEAPAEQGDEPPAAEPPAVEPPAVEPPAEEPPVEEPPAEEAVEEAPVEEPPAEETVEEAPVEEPPAEETVEEPPAEEAVEEPATEVVEESLAEVVEILHEEEVVLVDAEGEEIPLVSVEAAEVLSLPDPMYCPPGEVYGGPTCSPPQLTMAAAIADAAGNGGTIYVEGDEFAGFTLTGFDGYDLVIEGGVGGGTTIFNSQIYLTGNSANIFLRNFTAHGANADAGVNILGNPGVTTDDTPTILALNNSGTITLEHLVVDHDTDTAIYIDDHEGGVLLDYVDASNSGNGAYINNTANTAGNKNVLVVNSSFNKNADTGLTVLSKGWIGLDNVTANDNDNVGAYLETSGPGVIVLNSNFNNNPTELTCPSGGSLKNGVCKEYHGAYWEYISEIQSPCPTGQLHDGKCQVLEQASWEYISESQSSCPAGQTEGFGSCWSECPDCLFGWEWNGFSRSQCPSGGQVHNGSCEVYHPESWQFISNPLPPCPSGGSLKNGVCKEYHDAYWEYISAATVVGYSQNIGLEINNTNEQSFETTVCNVDAKDNDQMQIKFTAPTGEEGSSFVYNLCDVDAGGSWCKDEIFFYGGKEWTIVSDPACPFGQKRGEGGDADKCYKFENGEWKFTVYAKDPCPSGQSLKNGVCKKYHQEQWDYKGNASYQYKCQSGEPGHPSSNKCYRWKCGFFGCYWKKIGYPKKVFDDCGNGWIRSGSRCYEVTSAYWETIGDPQPKCPEGQQTGHPKSYKCYEYHEGHWDERGDVLTEPTSNITVNTWNVTGDIFHEVCLKLIPCTGEGEQGKCCGCWCGCDDDGECLLCEEVCKLPPAVCGDGLVTGDEVCDGGPNCTDDCTWPPAGACPTECGLDASQVPNGDGGWKECEATVLCEGKCPAECGLDASQVPNGDGGWKECEATVPCEEECPDECGLGASTVADGEGGQKPCAATVPCEEECPDECGLGASTVADGEGGQKPCPATDACPVTVAAPALFVPFGIPVTGGADLITAGIGHTCALTVSNGLECWGLNDSGQVGDGSYNDKLEPVDVVGIDPTAVIGLVSGIHHTCVLTSANEVSCWGLNSSGQLGDGSTENSNVPVLVGGLEGTITSISAGSEFTCAQNASGEVFCWGSNSSGQLNDGTEDNSSIPVKSTAVSSDTVLISGGSAELQGITSDGAVQLWNSEPIIPVTGLPNENNAFISADRFEEGGCSMTDAGEVNCWGAITDVEVSGALISEMLASGEGHACTITAEGLVCWGSNSNGQLGDGSLDDSDEVALVEGLDQTIIALTAGEKHTCVIYEDETVACWGNNEFGQLGNSSTDDSDLPVETS